MATKKSNVILEKLRAICLRFPEASEIETLGEPTLRVRNKIFAMYRQGSGHPSLWCKAPVGVQEDLVQDSYRMTAPKRLLAKLEAIPLEPIEIRTVKLEPAHTRKR